MELVKFGRQINLDYFLLIVNKKKNKLFKSESYLFLTFILKTFNKMKKKILIVLLLISSICFGQSSIKYALKGGLNSANTDFSVIVKGCSSGREYSNRNSYYLGGAIEFFINSTFKNLFLQVELIYSEQGWVYN